MNKKQLPAMAAKIANKAGRIIAAPFKRAARIESNMNRLNAQNAMQGQSALMHSPNPVKAKKLK